MNIQPFSRHNLGGACALAALVTGTFVVPSARAGYHPSVQEQQAISKLVADLASIRAGSDITDAEKQALSADIQLLTTSTTKPSQATVDQLTEDLSAALANGSLSPAEEAKLALDVDAVLNSAGLSTDDVQKFVADAQAIIASSGVTTADVQLIASDLAAVAAGIQLNFLTTNATFSLAPTASGGTAASGLGQLTSSINNEGTEGASLTLTTLGLTTGSYQVSATSAPTGAALTLGALTVVGRPASTGAGAVVFGGAGTPFPVGFEPANLTSVKLTDTAGAPQLTGSVSAATKFTRLANFRLVAGPSAPTALGNVALKVKTKSGTTKSNFLLYAWQLPVNTTLTLKANGVTVGTVPVDKKGHLVIAAGNVVLPVKADGVTPLVTPTPLPPAVDLNTLEFLELDDAQGSIIATAGFKS